MKNGVFFFIIIVFTSVQAHSNFFSMGARVAVTHNGYWGKEAMGLMLVQTFY